MKRLYLRLIILSLFILPSAFSVLAQRSNGLTVEGKISAEEGSVEGAVIQMIQDGRRLDNYGVGSDGRYKVELNYNHKFELIFTLKGNFSQKIVVDTNVPKNVLQSDPKFPPFPVDINLFTEIQGIDKTFSENTILKLYYNPQVDNFISERYYNDAQIKSLIDQAILQSKMIGKESDYLSKLTRAERAELKKEYDQLLKEAEKEYSNEQFLDALDGYKAANQIFPNEQYPKDRIAEINDLLGLMMVAEDMQKALSERFDKLIASADQFFASQKYFEARNSYNRALSIKSNDAHAKQRVAQIRDILQKQQTEQQYQDLIVRGNNAFNEVLYKEALQIFTEASELRPNESYPKSKISEINKKLSELAKNTENQKNYDQAIFQGELNFEKQFYDKALASYENALTYKPGDQKATDKIKEIRELMNKLVNQTLYDKLIKSADKAYSKEQFTEALADYEKALELFPDEAHPTERVASIKQMLASEDNFQAAIQKADQAFTQKEYQQSKSFYNQALEIHTNDKHSLDRIKEIDGILASLQVDEKYNGLITQADSYLSQKQYEQAKSTYNEALSIKSKEQYPKDKIAEINSILQEIARNDQKYQQTIAKADGLFKKENYTEAKPVYAEAKTIKPQENYPQEMIDKIDGLLQEQERLLAEQQAAEKARLEAEANERDKNYQNTIDEADRLAAENELIAAVGKFRAALEIKPQEQYPITRIEEIRGMITRMQEAQKAYEDAIARADKEYQREAFDNAKMAYNEAKQAKADETYPDEMIAKIDSIVQAREQLAAEKAAAEAARLAAMQAEKDSLYNTAVAKADGLFNSKEYENARTAYRSALDVKPEENYPQQRIDEIGTLLAQLSAAQKAYEDAITRADKDFKQEAFDNAKTAYNEAKQAKSDESYPDEMIAKIDSIVQAREQLAAEKAAAEAARLAAMQAEKDSLYNAAVAKADGMFNSKEYENARTAYRSALDIKPEETYPQQRIDEIGTLLAQLSAAQKAYEDAITRADKDFKQEAFDNAKTAYNEAKQAKSDETYPDEMIAKIDSIVQAREQLAAEKAAAEAARLAAMQVEKDSLYNAAVAKADGLFNSKEYENARTAYRSALDVKPEETYPQQRIDEIGTLLAQLSAAQKAYEDAITRADKDFKQEAFDNAKTAYNEAKQAKSDETYPDEMIAKIDSIIQAREQLAAEKAAAEAARLAALQAEKDSLYNAAVAKADVMFNSKEYENARTAYRSALDVKPEETYPQQRIDEIGTLLAQLSAAQKAYEDAITRADKDFKREAFDNAKTAYNEAKQAKSDETYPDEMIAKIDSIVQAREQLAAEKAAAEAARLAALQAEKDSLYNAAVAKADGMFNSKEYENARTTYRSALDVKPEENYPQQRIDEIGTLLAQLSAAQKAYEDAITRADKDFKQEAFDNAKIAYNEAKQAKADETYPDEMIAKIDSIVQVREQLAAEKAAAEAARLAAIQAEKDSLYNAAVAKADGMFNLKEYENARTTYRSALDIKQEETYPQQRIDEIGTLLAQLSAAQKEQEARNKNYEDALALADKYFNSKNYVQAKPEYQKALEIKPDESYPKQQIALADTLIYQQQQDEKYKQIILAADGYFKTESYNEAKTEYQNALSVKPEEQYPKNQIGKIDDIFRKEQERVLAEQQAAADLERRRNEIAQQNQAIEQQEIESEAGLTSLYNGYIVQADSYFENKQYNVSRGWYYKALDLKPEEAYPQQRIEEINRLVGSLLSSQRDRDYQNFIDLADSTFRENQFAVARGWYNRALSVKANEPYPKNQLNEIQRLIAERLAGQSGQLFESHVEKANKAFETQNYNVARFWYKKALELRPEAQEVKEKLEEIKESLK